LIRSLNNKDDKLLHSLSRSTSLSLLWESHVEVDSQQNRFRISSKHQAHPENFKNIT
jgi:hypothetical protein